MQLEINIHETVSGDLFIKELGYEQGFYDNSLQFNNSASITILTKVTTEDTEIIQAFIHNHKVTEVSNKFKIKQDGRYEVIHFVVPIVSKSQTTMYPQGTYVSDGSKLYIFKGGSLTEADLEEVITDGLLAENTVALVRKSIFVLYNMWQCYLNYCKKMLDKECATKCPECNDEGYHNRNLVWIFLNTIQYYVKFGMLQEAQKLYEEISGCNTLCSNEMFSKLYDCKCGK